MKKEMTWVVLAGMGFLASVESWASHYVVCDLEVKIVEVKDLARMNGAAVFSRDEARVPANHEQTVVLEVQKVIQGEEPGRSRCGQKAGDRNELHVSKDHQNQYKVDDVLRLSYRNVGDALGSRVSWEVVAPAGAESVKPEAEKTE